MKRLELVEKEKHGVGKENFLFMIVGDFIMLMRIDYSSKEIDWSNKHKSICFRNNNKKKNESHM